MGIDNKDTIDAIGLQKDMTSVILTIIDHNDWHDENDHLFLLQNKINSYISFVESGQLHEEYDQSIGKYIKFYILFKYDFPDSCADFLEKVRIILRNISIELEFNVHDDD